MHNPEYDILVRSVSGLPELRRVTEIQEWRVEQQMGSEDIVISVTAVNGDSQSFLVASNDARDISEVLRRRTGSPGLLK